MRIDGGLLEVPGIDGSSRCGDLLGWPATMEYHIFEFCGPREVERSRHVYDHEQ